MFTTEPMHVLQHYRWYTSDGVEDDPDYVDFQTPAVSVPAQPVRVPNSPLIMFRRNPRDRR